VGAGEGIFHLPELVNNPLVRETYLGNAFEGHEFADRRIN